MHLVLFCFPWIQLSARKSFLKGKEILDIGCNSGRGWEESLNKLRRFNEISSCYVTNFFSIHFLVLIPFGLSPSVATKGIFWMKICHDLPIWSDRIGLDFCGSGFPCPTCGGNGFGQWPYWQCQGELARDARTLAERRICYDCLSKKNNWFWGFNSRQKIQLCDQHVSLRAFACLPKLFAFSIFWKDRRQTMTMMDFFVCVFFSDVWANQVKFWSVKIQLQTRQEKWVLRRPYFFFFERLSLDNFIGWSTTPPGTYPPEK